MRIRSTRSSLASARSKRADGDSTNPSVDLILDSYQRGFLTRVARGAHAAHVIVAAVIALVVVAMLLVLYVPTTRVRTTRFRTVRRESNNTRCTRQWWREPEVPVARLPPVLASSHHHL